MEIQQLVEDKPGEPGDGVGIRGETGGGTEALDNKGKSLIPSFYRGKQCKENEDAEKVDPTKARRQKYFCREVFCMCNEGKFASDEPR